MFIKTRHHIVPVPSIINSEVWEAELILNWTNIKSQVVSNWLNIPNHGNVNYSTGELSWLVLSVCTGSLDKTSNDTEKELAMIAIQDAYTGSVLAWWETYTTIIWIDWNCWTNQNMNHWTMLTNASTIIPTDNQWISLTNALATWWLWNKLSWIVSSLPGARTTVGSFGYRSSSGYWWSSAESSTTNSWNYYLLSSNATVGNTDLGKAYGVSVVCIKN